MKNTAALILIGCGAIGAVALFVWTARRRPGDREDRRRTARRIVAIAIILAVMLSVGALLTLT